MVSISRILIVDRSELAGNLYKLLLAPLGAVIALRRRMEDARPDLIRQGAIQLLIVNSNAVGKKYPEIAADLEAQTALADVPKIFFCREDDSESEMRERFSELPEAIVISKPFHPDELATLVKRLAGRGVK